MQLSLYRRRRVSASSNFSRGHIIEEVAGKTSASGSIVQGDSNEVDWASAFAISQQSCEQDPEREPYLSLSSHLGMAFK